MDLSAKLLFVSSGLDALAKVSEVQFELEDAFADEGGDGEGGCFFLFVGRYGLRKREDVRRGRG